MTQLTTVTGDPSTALHEALDDATLDALAVTGAVHFRDFAVDQDSFPEATRRFGSRTTCDPAKASSNGLAGRQDRLGRALRGVRRATERLPFSGLRPATTPRLAPWGGSGINPHTENAFLPRARPDLVWFFCAHPADDGGASILADGVEVARALAEDVLDVLRNTRLRYRTPLTVSQWSAVYDTDDRRRLADLLDGVDGLEYRFSEDGRLDLDYCAPQVRATMFDGAEAVNTNLLSRRPYGKVGEPEHDVTADDRPVDRDLVQAVLDATSASSVEIDLAAGDVLLIDNTRVMHGRGPFTDHHRRVLTMCTFVDRR